MNLSRLSRPFAAFVIQALANLFFLWVIFRYALGGWETAQILLTQIGLPAWIALAVVSALVLYRSDYRADVPLFIAAVALGYWGEWWGTSRGVWTYWNHATPPDYLPPLWAIGLLTVTHLRALIMDTVSLRAQRSNLIAVTREIASSRSFASLRTLLAMTRARVLTVTHLRALIMDTVSLRAQRSNLIAVTREIASSRSFASLRTLLAMTPTRTLKSASFVVLPALAFAVSAPRLAAVDWTGRLDVNFFAGIAAGIALLLYRFDIDETFGLYVCGMLLGGTYEWLGTWMGEWTYITREVPPLWIIPLWGLACVAMVKLSQLIRLPLEKTKTARLKDPSDFR